ncbi:unnamed protein product [Clavelina lepadiformis]|uniref:Uncharacterized protein n=1 Tax=Clavelina lepadiformis TaxID=159417 RepID=A0ABP0FGQ2_CLALP
MSPYTCSERADEYWTCHSSWNKNCFTKKFQKRVLELAHEGTLRHSRYDTLTTRKVMVASN